MPFWGSKRRAESTAGFDGLAFVETVNRPLERLCHLPDERFHAVEPPLDGLHLLALRIGDRRGAAVEHQYRAPEHGGEREGHDGKGMREMGNEQSPVRQLDRIVLG